MSERNFKNKTAYMDWLAYGHMHTKKGLYVDRKIGRKPLMTGKGPFSKISIKGKMHKVHHHKF